MSSFNGLLPKDDLDENSFRKSAHASSVHNNMDKLDSPVSIRVSRTNQEMEKEKESSEEDDDSSVPESKRKGSMISQRTGAMPNIIDLFKQQQAPSRFLMEVKKRKESEDLVKLGKYNNSEGSSISISSALFNDRSFDAKKGPSESKFAKSGFAPSGEKPALNLKRDSDNDSVMSSRRQVMGASDFERIVNSVHSKFEDSFSRGGGSVKRAPMVSEANGSVQVLERKKTMAADFKDQANKGAGALTVALHALENNGNLPMKVADKTDLFKRFQTAVRLKIIKNLQFFKILSNSHFMDDRALKQRYCYLYQDLSVDATVVEKIIRENRAKEFQSLQNLNKKVKAIKQKFEQRAAQARQEQKKDDQDEEKERKRREIKEVEPDYAFKEQIDLPMKFETVDPYVFNPYSPYMILWKASIFAELLAILFLKPFFICYTSDLDDPDYNWVADAVDAFHALNIIDMVIQMNSIYYEKGEPVGQSKKILRKFWREILPFEFLGIINCLLFFYRSITSHRSDWLYFVELPLIFVWVYKIDKIEKNITDYLMLSEFSTYIFKISKLLVLMVMIAHWMSCIWFLVLKYDIDGQEFFLKRIIYPEDMANLYVVTFYYVITVMATVGFGEFIPKTTIQRIMCLIFILFSTFVFAYTVNSIGNIYDERVQISNNKKIKLVELNEYLRNKNVSRALRVDFFADTVESEQFHGVRYRQPGQVLQQHAEADGHVESEHQRLGAAADPHAGFGADSSVPDRLQSRLPEASESYRAGGDQEADGSSVERQRLRPRQKLLYYLRR